MLSYPVRRPSRLLQLLWGGAWLMAAGGAQAANVDLNLTQCLTDPNPGIRGGEITYRLNYENGSGAAASNSTITIPLPATSVYVAGSASSGCDHNGQVPGTLTCNFASIAGGAQGTAVFKLRTTGATSTSISSMASIAVGAGDADPNAANNTQNCGATINNGADLSAAVSGPATAVGGGTITWTVNGSNSGPDAAANQTFTTTLPSTLTYVSASGTGWSCSASGQNLQCLRTSSLADSNAYPQLSLVTRLSNTVSSGNVTLAGSIGSSTGDPRTDNNTDSHTVAISPGADLEVTEAVPLPSPVAPGESLTYVLKAVNNGPSPASAGFTLSFQLPAGFTPGSVTPTGAGWGSCSWSGQQLNCPYPGSYASGRSETVTITAIAPNDSVPTTYNGPSDNLATITAGAGGPVDPVLSNNTAVRPVQVAPDNAVDLAFTKNKGPNPVAVGSPIVSSIHMTNALGPYAAATGSVTLTDVLDSARETYDSATGPWTCVATADVPVAGKTSVACTNTAPIPVGGALDLAITTHALVAGVITNNAAVHHPGQWNSIGVISASVTATAGTNSPDLAITKSVSTPSDTQTGGRITLLNTENTLTYTLLVSNLGDSVGAPIDAVDLQILDQIPGFIAGKTVIGTVVATVSSGNGSTATFACSANASGQVKCDQSAGVLKKNDTVTVVIPVSRGLTAGDLTNQASVYSTSQGDPARDNNVASVNLRVQPIADLQMVGKAVAPTTVAAGTNATYTLTFKNEGPNDSSAVVVKDDFVIGAGDPGFTFISASTNAGGSCTGLTAGTNYSTPGTHTLMCSGFTLTSGQQRTVTVVVRPNWKSGTEGTASLVNQARIYSTATAEDLTGALGDPGAGVSRGSLENFKSATLTVGNAGLNALIVTNDNAPAGPDPLGFDPAAGGDNANNHIAYLVRMTNQGPSLATGLRFTYQMTPPAGKTMRFIGDSTSVGSTSGGICDSVNSTITGPATLTVTCTYPTAGGADQLLVDDSRQRYLTFRALTEPDTSGYTVQTRAQVFTNEVDNNPADDVATEQTTVRMRADIDISMPNHPAVEVFEPFNWTINVLNNGPGTSGQTDLRNTLPTGMEFHGALPTWTNPADGTSGTCSILGQVLNCDFGALHNGSTAVVTVPVRFTSYPSGGTQQSCATATTDQVDPNSSNNVGACGTVTVIKSSVAGVVFVDLNNNGLFETGESGISGALVRLTGTDAYGNQVDVSVPTQQDGSFLIDNLNSADSTGYTLTQVLPTGYFDGLDTVGSAGGTHAQSGSTDLISAIALGRNTAATDYQFGEISSASLAGRVCVDSNDNGVCEPGEHGLQGVSISLSGKTVNGIDVCQVVVPCTVTTDASGAYVFAVPASDLAGYTLTQQANNTPPLNAFVDGRDGVGSLGGTVHNNPAGSDSISAIVVRTGETGTAYDFGERGSSLAGLVYLDRNDDGQRSGDEPGIPGVVMHLSGTTANGTSICGNLLPLAACTTTTLADGSYVFSGLPNGTYTVTEDQPAGYSDGRDTPGTGGGTAGGANTDSITGITLNGSDIGGYLFGERDSAQAATANVTGTVWFESLLRNQNHDPGEKGLPGWHVEARSADGRLVATTITDDRGQYSFDLLPGNYSLSFLHPVSSAVYGTPVSGDPAGTANRANRTLDLVVTPGANVVEQNLPVDPSGVVYDAITRELIAGALVEIQGPAGFNPATDLVGGAAAASQLTGIDGFYQFFLMPGAPAGPYTLSIKAPAGYLNGPSTLIPPQGGSLTSTSTGAPYNVVPHMNAPQGPQPTTWYINFTINPANADDILNNHIPLDPILGGAIVMTKNTPKVNVTRGELVPYTLTARNTLSSAVPNIAIEDQIPPGFKYVKKSAQVDGVPIEPLVEGRRLRWPERTLNGGQVVVIKLLLVVGSGVGFNEYVNQTWALSLATSSRVSNVATATVRVVADPTFDCSDLIGTVFDDKNRDGYQNEGEPGIAGVRVATPRGLLVTTDQYGRYHIACADIPSELRGSNFILKVDERTLPSGYRVTTENPRVVRITQGRLTKANFGASIHRTVRLDLSSEAFGRDDQLTATYQAQIGQVLPLLYAEPSILRIAYRMSIDGDIDAARARIGHVRDWIKAHWEPHDCCYDLQVEEEIVPAADSVEVIR